MPRGDCSDSSVRTPAQSVDLQIDSDDGSCGWDFSHPHGPDEGHGGEATNGESGSSAGGWDFGE